MSFKTNAALPNLAADAAAMAQHEANVAAITQREAKDTMTSARLECLLVIWRVREALQAMPRPADNMTIRRWNHGIAQELVGSS
ncbi:hypothetical protein GSI_11346 [Ganoderma sinense ZZ0214-1]|uniref:Uncharacterized protein n=1 Tax=Ganoderma sinense ZZ0214-1 TaxID=1077348 RepID=A0A2G8RW87_9APHY|nr:hypothetical protein GSI_11346 [Ganoderma sinense ZZ0214-1]